MGLVHQKYKVAVVQAAPVFLDLDATVDKTIALADDITEDEWQQTKDAVDELHAILHKARP